MKILLLLSAVFIIAPCAIAQSDSSPSHGHGNGKFVLLAAQESAAWADMITTEKMRHGYVFRRGTGLYYQPPGIENDPIVRPLLALPEPAYFAVGSAATFSLFLFERRLSRHHKVWARIIAGTQIAANSFFAGRNAVVLAHRP